MSRTVRMSCSPGALLRVRPRGGWMLLALMGCLEAPINPNPSLVPLANAIEGEVVFGGTDEDPIGPTYMTVYRADNPGPPTGTGSPVTFSSVPEAAFSDPDAGLRAANFGVSGLADGSYLVNALMDIDGDFNPFVSVLAGATCGDWVGTHLESIDLENPQPAAVPVEGGELREGVTVFVGQPIPTERPAFQFVPIGAEQAGNPIISLAAAQTVGVGLFRLGATTIETGFGPDVPVSLGPACPSVRDLDDSCAAGGFCACIPDTFVDPESPIFNPCATALFLWLVDRDADGLVDIDPATGQLDIWPRVYLQYIGDPGPAPTYAYNGRIVEERWVAQGFPLLAEILTVAARYKLGPEAVAPIGVKIPTADLSVSLPPVFVHYHENGALEHPTNGYFDLVDLRQGGSADAVPTGPWAVSVISFTGQTWAVPNEIGALQLPGPPPFDPLTQAAAVVITP